ncbi:putative short-chain dehydrogenase [Phialemonium atrogriseum]|uniref:Short-chain dehydrogenase n=1 Tax=Phialemonium atrogriseum TaxID=1093897 RepID=A0AAJ0C085_9PEZI|nr:putative short-chain dehydrogenase [Phialemonium atrogriseum]KAK1767506.1 putative short-chain dehydrogenase [Phialemonium atrogriseum]
MSPFSFHTIGEEVAIALADRVKGRTFVITGASEKSLAASAAIELAKQSPEHIVFVARSKAKIDPVTSEIQSIASSVKTTFVQCDLTDQESIRNAAEEINSNGHIEKIDALINSAGIMNIKDYTVDNKGNELTFSANHIGHFLLTNLLIPKILAAGKGARIVNLTSRGHRISNVRFDDPDFSGGAAYDGWSAYGQSKTANVLFSVELDRRLAGRGVRSYAVHPGSIWGTGLATHLDMSDFGDIDHVARRNTGRPFTLEEMKTIPEGTSAMLVAALDPDLESRDGVFVEDCQHGEPYDYALDPEGARRLWKLSEALVGQEFDP